MFCLYNNSCNITVPAIRKENRSRLGIGRINMSNTILLLFCTGVLVLFDHALLIVVNARTGNNSRLGTTIHIQFINIIIRCIIPDKRAILHPFPEKIVRSLINTWIILSHIRTKECLCPVNRQKRMRELAYMFCRLRPVIYIVWKSSNRPCHIFPWTNCCKRSDSCHICFFLSIQYTTYLTILTRITPSTASSFSATSAETGESTSRRAYAYSPRLLLVISATLMLASPRIVVYLAISPLLLE